MLKTFATSVILLSTVAQASPDCLTMLNTKLLELKSEQNDLLNEIVEAKASYRGLSVNEKHNRAFIATSGGIVLGGALGSAGPLAAGFISKTNTTPAVMIGAATGAIIGGLTALVSIKGYDNFIEENDENLVENVITPQSIALNANRAEERFLLSLKQALNGNPGELESQILSKSEWQTFLNEGFESGDFCSGGVPISSEEFKNKQYLSEENKKVEAKNLEMKILFEKQKAQAIYKFQNLQQAQQDYQQASQQLQTTISRGEKPTEAQLKYHQEAKAYLEELERIK